MKAKLHGRVILEGLEAFADATLREVPASFPVVKFGKTVYTKDGERGEYEFNPADADTMLADFAERNKDGVIDYEHETLKGGKAPAAGWIQRLEKTEAGVVAHVRYWTDEAKRLLTDGAYRYFSPVLAMSRRHPMALHSVALTNHPATHGIPALVMDDETDESDETDKGAFMDLKKLAEALGVTVVALADGKGLDEVATQAAVEAEIIRLLGLKAERTAFLTLHESPDLDAVTGKIKGMVPAAELTALNDRLAGIEAEKAVAKAFADRKLVEAQRGWALAYARKDQQAFADFVAAAPEVAPATAAGAGVNVQGAAEGKALALTDVETKTFRRMGLSDKDIEAIKQDRKG
jgi:phage I-like protein